MIERNDRLDPYGQHYLLDMRGCDAHRFHRVFVKSFMKNACGIFGLRAGPLHFWDFTDPCERARAQKHLAGISAVQFIETSNIVIHCIDHRGIVMIDVFVCGTLHQINIDAFRSFTEIFWRASASEDQLLNRGSALYPIAKRVRYLTS